MANSTASLDRVMGRLFDRESKRQNMPLSSGGSGGRGRGRSKPSVSRMSRANAPQGKAIFKLIRKGGTQNRSGLRGQMEYIFNDEKVARIMDSSGALEGKDLVGREDLNRITRDWSLDWKSNMRNGHTSHMILSYPGSVSISDVEKITKAVCNEMFETGDAQFKYVAAIHDDHDHHPHAHIIVNRRASDGSLLNMRSGTQHSYEGFRESMAAHAERLGIYLDPTFRFERGDTNRQPIRKEQLEAQEQRREPTQRKVTGKELEVRKEQVSWAKITYNSMAVIAANADCPRLERAYQEMANLLENENGEHEMPQLSVDELERFDQYTAILNEAVERTEALLESKNPADRVQAEVQMNEIMNTLTQLNPRAEYSKDLHEAPDGNSIYMQQVGDNVGALRSAQLQERFQETEAMFGLDANAVMARIEAGNATSRSLEISWVQSDLKAVAEHGGHDLETKEGFGRSVFELDAAYQDIHVHLANERVLQPTPEMELKAAHEELREHPSWRDAVEDEISIHANELKQLGHSDLDIHERSNELEEYAEGRLERNPELIQLTPEDRTAYAQLEKEVQFVLSAELEPNTNAGDREDIDALKSQIDAFSDRSEAHSELASRTWGNMPDLQDRPEAFEQVEPLAKYEARSSDEYSVARSAADVQDIVSLLKDNLSAQGYDRFARGDLDEASHLTTDPLFARQLNAVVEGHERSNGTEFTPEEEVQLREHREYVLEKTEAVHEHDHGHER